VIAPPEMRLRRVMQHRSLRESQARLLIAQGDAQRGGFYQSHFGADWSSPLEYHLTVNSGRLGPPAVDLIAAATSRHWAQAPRT
jgi:cytidylate kinase